MKNRVTALGTCISFMAAGAIVGGCDDGANAPPTAAGGVATAPPAPTAAPAPAPPAPPPGATGMNPASGALANLSEKPNSLLGKSAAAGRETGRKIEQAQQQAVGAAGVLSGDRVAAEIGPLLFHPPAEWEALKPTAQFQTALYRVAADEGEGEARVVFFHFTQGGGDVASNIARWRGMVIGPDGQPAEALVRDRTLAGYKTKLVSMEGTYKDGMPGGPTTDRPNYGFRGAIIETDQGNVFVRFFGPKALVDANAKTWEEMVIGAARK